MNRLWGGNKLYSNKWGCKTVWGKKNKRLVKLKIYREVNRGNRWNLWMILR